jgi:uracil DNA glycosylase
MMNLKLVIIGQEPYHKLGYADGISFSCSNNLDRTKFKIYT